MPQYMVDRHLPGELPSSVVKRVSALIAFGVIGGLFGLAMSSIPSPHSVSVFWVGNLCTPWLVLAFFAGRAHGSWRWAAVSGVVTEVACVVGFYVQFLTFDRAKLGVPAETANLTVASTSLTRWLAFLAPWLLAAVLAGALYGLLGNWWRHRRPFAAGLAVALPFVAEPGLWMLRVGYKGPWFIWAVEVLVGAAVALTVIRQGSMNRTSVGE